MRRPILNHSAIGESARNMLLSRCAIRGEGEFSFRCIITDDDIVYNKSINHRYGSKVFNLMSAIGDRI